jgi:hypothetical protein
VLRSGVLVHGILVLGSSSSEPRGVASIAPVLVQDTGTEAIVQYMGTSKQYYLPGTVLPDSVLIKQPSSVSL